MSSLRFRSHPLATAAAQRACLAELPIATPFEAALARTGLSPLRATGVEIFQMNLGKKCNQTCRHCHVDAGPDRREVMPDDVVDACLRALAASRIPTLDITGGAPEMHPRFRDLVTQARALGRHVMDRCNLTILRVPAYEDLGEFLAAQQVEIVASLPSPNNRQTDAQRGEGVFERSIVALQQLNALGYGTDPRLQLNLVTNPVGAFLPANQKSLESDWKRELARRHQVTFNHLYTITNMPISRYLEYLVDSGNLEPYMQRLVQAYNPAAAAGVMCRNMLSVGWDGTLYDCDFNQMLEMPVNHGAPRHISGFDAGKLDARQIETGPHCFGCTAGGGSSCGGATAV